MLGEFHRLHVSLRGDSTLAGAWLAFAKEKVRTLLKQQAAFGGNRNQARRYTPVPNVVITVRIVGEDKWIGITASSGCTDRRGFLLDRASAAYSALYNDGVTENINPIDGTPRPVPDGAVRTKGYKVPQQLRRDPPNRRTASQFSGLMRLAVGCQHAAGQETPFSPAFIATHGIVKTAATVNSKATTLYWVVEISSLGVYAAPIANTGDCCDSWSVVAYQPTAAEIAANANLSTYKTTLSLWWASSVHRKGVLELIPSVFMAAAYAAGNPWYDNCGWAFTASGIEAQSVMQYFSTTDASHYVCSRWKVNFALAPADNTLTAVITAAEVNKVAGFVGAGSTVWWPTSDGVWTGAFAATSLTSPSPFTTFPAQDAPIHVFYNGETEIVTRWSFARASVAQERITGGGSIISGPPVDLPDNGCVVNGLNSRSYTFGTGDLVTFAHVRLTCGFTNTAGACVGDSYSRREDNGVYAIADYPPEVVGPYSQTVNLEPGCYYLDGDPPTVVTSCNLLLQDVYDRVLVTGTATSATVATSHASSIVMFAEEREALLVVCDDSRNESGTYETSIPQVARLHTTTTKVGGNEKCPWVDLSYDDPEGEGNLPGGVAGAGSYATHSDTGHSTLLLGDNVFTVPLTFGPAPFYDIGNGELSTFLNWSSSKQTAESNVLAMHGNMYYPDAGAVPMSQRENYVYLQNNLLVVNGGFPMPAGPIAFVGKS